MKVLEYISNNKEWIFSGVGPWLISTVFGGLVLLRSCSSENARETKKGKTLWSFVFFLLGAVLAFLTIWGCQKEPKLNFTIIEFRGNNKEACFNPNLTNFKVEESDVGVFINASDSVALVFPSSFASCTIGLRSHDDWNLVNLPLNKNSILEASRSASETLVFVEKK